MKGIDGDERVERIRLGDGTTLEADLVVVGIGVHARDPMARRAAGSPSTTGSLCDETGLAAPGVVAAGDVARWPNPLFDGEVMRLEHWTNATEQGVHAAKRLLAGEHGANRSRRCRSSGRTSTTARSRPSGSSPATPTCTSRTGRSTTAQFVALFGRDDRIVGALGFNRPRQVMQYRKLIAERGVVGRRARALERSEEPGRDARSLLTTQFVLVVTCGLAYFLGLAMLTPVIPHYVEDELGLGKVAVGVAVGAFAFGAIALRPFAGRIGDRLGRRVLIVGGALVVAVSTACYGLVARSCGGSSGPGSSPESARRRSSSVPRR